MIFRGFQKIVSSPMNLTFFYYFPKEGISQARIRSDRFLNLSFVLW